MSVKKLQKTLDIDIEQLADRYPDATKDLLELTEALKAKELQREGNNSFLTYVRHIWPDFIEGRHHQIFAEKLERVAKGELKRLIVNMPPRHTKSEFASTYFPWNWLFVLDVKSGTSSIHRNTRKCFRGWR